MRFEKVKLTNYRQYKDLEFEFEKTDPFDMHVIVASNGIGKTNLLNAINWCLYGDEPHVSGTEQLSEGSEPDKLPLANVSVLKEYAEKGIQSCPVTVEIKATDGSSKYTFRRTANIDVDAKMQFGKDLFQVEEITGQGETKFHDGDAAAGVVDFYLPKKIREYFFFDGEQLLNYFGRNKQNVSHLKDSVYLISGVTTINNTEKHLDGYISSYQSELKKLNPDLQKYADAVEDAKKAVENKEKEIETLKAQIIEAGDAIEEANKIIKGTEGIIKDNEKFESNKIDINATNTKLEECREELSVLVRKYALLMMLYDVNRSNAEYIEERQKEDDTSPVSDIEILKRSLESHHCIVCGADLNKEAEDFFKAAIEKYYANASIKKLLTIRNNVVQATDISGYETEKGKIVKQIGELTQHKNSLEEENEELFKKISTVTGKDTIKEAICQRETNEKLKESNIEKKGKYQEQLKQMKERLADKEKEYSKAMESDKKCNAIKEKYEFVDHAKKMVSEIKDGIVHDVTDRLEKETLKYFEDLQWKKNTYGRVELDDAFRLRLYNKDGWPCLDSCSASEKELLALSFVISVDDIAGYSENLLFIDTPVGRVSDFNRTNFAKFLLEISREKQIILAFTPSEYKGEIADVINERVVASMTKLDTNDSETETTVR